MFSFVAELAKQMMLLPLFLVIILHDHEIKIMNGSIGK
jgi:hypothetical protein